MGNPYEDLMDHRLSLGSLFGGDTLEKTPDPEEEDEPGVVQDSEDDKDDLTFGDEGVDDNIGD